MHAFVCPDCHCAHYEPAEASYVLAVRCFDCSLADEYHAGIGEIVASVARAA